MKQYRVFVDATNCVLVEADRVWGDQQLEFVREIDGQTEPQLVAQFRSWSHWVLVTGEEK